MGEKVRITLDNMVFSLQKAGGGSVYWAKVIEACLNDDDIDLTVIEREDALGNIERGRIDLKGAHVPPRGRMNLRLDEVRKVGVEGRSIFHSSYYRSGKGSGCINVTTVHDFICMRQFEGIYRSFMFWQIKRAVMLSDAIICISESTKRDLLEYIPAAKDIPITIIPQGYDSDVFTYAEAERKKQVVFIGARNVAYKNFHSAVSAVSEVEDLTLVIVGAPLSDSELELLEGQISGRYQSLEYPSADEICHVFRESIALLYLSDYEGFGVPPLEAMASGLPVIALNKSSVPEVVGDAAILLEDADPAGVSAEIRKLVDDDGWFKERVGRGLDRVKMFSWDITAEKTKAFYKKLWSEAK